MPAFDLRTEEGKKSFAEYRQKFLEDDSVFRKMLHARREAARKWRLENQHLFFMGIARKLQTL